MHEFALAQELLKVIEAETKEKGAIRVGEVKLRIGRLSMVTADSIRSAFELVSQGSIAEGARIEVDEEEAEMVCKDCGRRFMPDADPVCPSCKGTRLEATGGRDISVASIEQVAQGARDI